MLYLATHLVLFSAEPSRLWRRLLAIAVSPAVPAVSGLGFVEFWDAGSVIMRGSGEIPVSCSRRVGGAARVAWAEAMLRPT
jgi:hypothetical protein